MPPGDPNTPPSATEVYSAYLSDLLVAERARKADLMQRGVGIVTTSSGIATLFFGFVALFPQAPDATVPTEARWAVATAITLFAAAAVCGIVTTWPLGHKDITGPVLEPVTPPADGITAQDEVLKSKQEVFDRTQQDNLARVKGLTVGLFFEVAAVFAVAVTVGLILVYRA